LFLTPLIHDLFALDDKIYNNKICNSKQCSFTNSLNFLILYVISLRHHHSSHILTSSPYEFEMFANIFILANGLVIQYTCTQLIISKSSLIWLTMIRHISARRGRTILPNIHLVYINENAEFNTNYSTGQMRN
jgi:hypothetical protein